MVCPTSVGYGAVLGGAAPMLASLACTTPGVSVVNVDNGLGAAMSATRILRMANKLFKTRTAALQQQLQQQQQAAAAK